MSEQTDDTNVDDTDQKSDGRNWRRDLEARAVAAETEKNELKARLDAIEREKAFSEAGLDLKNKQHAVFAKAYEGDLTAEAIRKDAEETGFLTPKTTEAPREELSMIANMDRASLNAQPSAPTGSFEEAYAKLASTNDPEEFWAIAQSNGWVAGK